MKIHIRLDDSNAAHTRLSVFVNGAYTGALCLRTEEVVTFLMILRSDFTAGRAMPGDTYLETGRLWVDPKEVTA
jgi:hypothetical protein